MNDDFLLDSTQAKKIYEGIKDLPIIDYHCHLSPKEILDDKVFSNIGEIWLGGDHYKWRLMRQAGIEEKYITGDASWKEKFRKYAEVVSISVGNPLFDWSRMELNKYFGIDEPLDETNADRIFDQVQKVIDEKEISPRKLISMSGVECIVTTDDPADDMDDHILLNEDKNLNVNVIPAFRTDRILNLSDPEYNLYIEKLGKVSGVDIDDLSGLKTAIERRLREFIKLGCVFSDCGIEGFPGAEANEKSASEAFEKALKGGKINKDDKNAFWSYMFVWLASIYKESDIIMQLHLAAKRNANMKLVNDAGKDSGADCIGDALTSTDIAGLLNSLEIKNCLPTTIIYTLEPSMNAMLASVCGTFRGVVPGAAWWFCDHEMGIRNVLETIASEGFLGAFAGMLTDSRSFLSYARFEYFRRILSSFLGKYVEKNEFQMSKAEKLAYMLSYGNIKEMMRRG
jgi:glucuronate isomerase